MSEIAVLGTGRMGTPMARRLIEAGHRVRVWNRSPERAKPLEADGAEIAATPAEAVDGADFVVTMLTDATAVRAALDAAAPALRAGMIVVQTSTVGPDEVREIASRLPTGVDLLDAPVGGSVNAVEAGTLVIFAGGPEATIAAAEPVLRPLGKVRPTGPIGTGSAVKLVNNTAMVTALAALHDSLTVAASVGVDREVALDVLAGGPLAGAVQRFRTAGGNFALSLAAKDLRLARRDAPGTPIAEAALTRLGELSDQDADVTAIV
ncbi:NAD(P)-dependent oxidoreductase [Hamadaea sp. NPDC050747]|uniref:NAD(P)-dependent oxidoreductase n=1 Tax=Hamadaea sp. NPDC050747 TaxID=3155789 RepID=UPI0033FDBB76